MEGGFENPEIGPGPNGHADMVPTDHARGLAFLTLP
jgi:hypothetical protein